MRIITIVTNEMAAVLKCLVNFRWSKSWADVSCSREREGQLSLPLGPLLNFRMKSHGGIKAAAAQPKYPQIKERREDRDLIVTILIGGIKDKKIAQAMAIEI